MKSQKINLQRDYLSKIKIVLLVYVFIGLILSCSIFLIPVSIGEFFTIHFNSGSNKARLLQLFGIHLTTLSSFFFMFSALLVVRTIFEFLERWVSYNQGELYAKFIREKLFVAQIAWGQERFEKKHFGKYLLRYSNDMKSMQSFLTRGIMGCIKDICFLSMGFWLLWFIHHRLSLYLLIMTVIIMVLIFSISILQKKLIESSRNKRSGLLAMIAKSFQQHQSIKEKKREEITEQRFKKRSDELYAANMLNNRFDSLLQALLPMFQFSMIGILLWFMSLSTSAISVNDSLVFILITLMMISPMKRVLKVPAIINKGKISLEKINEIMNFPPEVVTKDDFIPTDVARVI